MYYSDLNLINVTSELVNQMRDNGDNDDNLDIDITYHDIEIMIDFNNRNITTLNINRMLSFCDYLLLSDTLYFLINNSVPTLEKYILDEDHLKYTTLPRFMSTCNAIDILKCNIPNLPNLLNWLIFSCNNLVAWHNILCTLAGANKHINCLIYLHEHDYNWSINTLEEIILRGNYECFEYAVNNGCKINNNALTYLIKFDKFNCLKYLLDVRKHEITLNTARVIYNAILVNDKCAYLDYFLSLEQIDDSLFAFNEDINYLDLCIYYNSVKCLQYFVKYGKINDKNKEGLFLNAAKRQSYECFVYLHQQGCEITDHIALSCTSLEHHNLTLIKYLFDQGFRWDNRPVPWYYSSQWFTWLYS